MSTYVCNTNPPNPDPNGVQDFTGNDVTVNVLPGAEINTEANTGIETIDLSNGSDNVTVTDGAVRSGREAITTASNDDTVKVENSIISGSGSAGEAIETGNDEDTIEVINSEVTSQQQDAIDSGNDDDKITVIDSILTSLGNPSTINASSGNDMLTILRSRINGTDTAISMSSENDIVNLGTGAEINGTLDCGSDIDTVVFQMEVPEEALNLISSEIAALIPGDVQTIVINGLVYHLEDCEIFVNELVGVRVLRPIPTLSEWGLIAMAGILGIVGLIAVRRRKVTA